MVRKRKGKEGQGEDEKRAPPSTSQGKETTERRGDGDKPTQPSSSQVKETTERSGDGDKPSQPSTSQETAAAKGAQGKRKEKKQPPREQPQTESQPQQKEQRQVASGAGETSTQGARGKQKSRQEKKQPQEKRQPTPEHSQTAPQQSQQRQVSESGDAPVQGARSKRQAPQERRQPTPEQYQSAPQQSQQRPVSESGDAPVQGAWGKRQAPQERRQPTPEQYQSAPQQSQQRQVSESGDAPVQGAWGKRQAPQERRQPTTEQYQSAPQQSQQRQVSESGDAPVQGAWGKRQAPQERRQPTPEQYQSAPQQSQQRQVSESGDAPVQGAWGKRQAPQERRQPTPEQYQSAPQQSQQRQVSESGDAPVQGAWGKRQAPQERRQPPPEQYQSAPQQSQQRQAQPQAGQQRQAWRQQPSSETSAVPPPGFDARSMPRGESGGRQPAGRGMGRGGTPPREATPSFREDPRSHPAERSQQYRQPQQSQQPPQARQQRQQPPQPRQQPQQPQQPQQYRQPQQPQAMQQQGDVSFVTKQLSTTTLSPLSGYPIPMRKNLKVAGTLGRRTRVETNHVSIDFSRLKNTIAIHYDVAVTPETPKRLIRGAVVAFVSKNCPGRYPAFDGVKNLYSSGPLPFNDRLEGTIKQEDEQSNGRAVEFKIVIKRVNEIDLSTLQSFIVSNRSLDHPQTAIQCLDVVFRSAPSSTFVRVGRSFFTPPQGSVVALGDGLDLWYGFFQSAILGWKPFLNVDVAHKGFPKAQHVLSLLCEVMEKRPEDVPHIDFGREVARAKAFETALKGLKVQHMVPNAPGSKRTYSVNGLGRAPKLVKFKTDDGKEMNVYDYYLKEKNYRIKYPDLPCLHVGPRDRNIQIIMELCTILPNQVTNRKLNDLQTRSMIRAAATPTNIRKQKIHDAFQKANFNNDPCLREFGLSVSQNFEQVDARIMEPPNLQYKKANVTPRQGVWRADAFHTPKDLIEWTILNLDYRTRDDSLLNFSRMMVAQGRILGMAIQQCKQPTSIDSRRKNDIEQFLKRNQKLNLIVVVLPNMPGIYSVVKQIAELSVGVVTQCIKSQTMFKMNVSTAVNILLKVNAKLNGVNHIIADISRPKIMDRPCMVMGADVTHPSPDAKDIPSVAAVVASHDCNATRYNFCWRLQPPAVEIIEDLQNIVREHLLYFFKNCNGHKPENILFFRDGVSEGQFKEVLRAELSAIRRACQSVEQDYKPSILFLVVQKRHHTRFFPIRREDEDGKNKNVPAGTIVDTQITHPQHIDFYLCSHASIQGVARPTKYRVLWNDKDLTENEIEELTYFLCHLFTRCTRTVSYPAPTYYAHLAAFRARHYIEGSRINFDNLAREMQSRQIQISQNPMFFV